MIVCNCQLCRFRKGDKRNPDDIKPLEETLPFIDRIYSIIGKDTLMTVPDTPKYRIIQAQYKNNGFNMKIKSIEIIL